MNFRSLALSIAALSAAHITTAAAQSVYVAPGGVYIGGGPVYVTPAPSYGNGPYGGPSYGYGVPGPAPYVAPTVAAPYGLNGNGYGDGYGKRLRQWQRLWLRPAAAGLLQQRVKRIWPGAPLRLSCAAAAVSDSLRPQRALYRRPVLRTPRDTAHSFATSQQRKMKDK